MIEPCPQSGHGVHYWLPGAARRLRNAGHDGSAVFAELKNAVANCGRNVPDIEIQNAVNLVFTTETTGKSRRRYNVGKLTEQKTYSRSVVPKIKVDEKRKQQITQSGHSLDDLIGMSPIFFSSSYSPKPEDYLKELFDEDEYICVATNGPESAKTKTFSQWWGHLSGCQLIVPSPMTAPTGKNKQGKITARSLSNTGKRRHIVIESDINSADEQAAILLHLDKFAPLVMAVSSGGKSIHGWFYFEGHDHYARKFMAYAQSLGADGATLIKCQLVRMPAGTRGDGTKQKVLYFNPITIRKIYDKN